MDFLKKLFSKKEMDKDPVCGMDVNLKTVTLHTFYKGKNYYFCSENCLSKFKSQPEQNTVHNGSGGCKCCH